MALLSEMCSLRHGMERSDVYAIATRLMSDNGLCTWTFAFDRAKTRAGMCNHATKTISLSELYTTHPQTTPDHIKDTILHEIAHALTPGCRHGDAWKKKAMSIGCSATRCCEHFTQKPFVLTCACGKVTISRHRIHPKLKRAVCKVCHGHLSVVI